MKANIILTCEHANNNVPSKLKSHTQIPSSILNSHRGYDVGALNLAKALKKLLQAELYFTEISRLVIDTNRRLNNKAFSPYTSHLPEDVKKTIIIPYNQYRETVGATVAQSCKKKQFTFVLSIHSFTPTFKGKKRQTDIGLLYRTDIAKEAFFASALKQSLTNLPYKVHFNRPYRGYTDCLLNDIADRHLNDKFITSLFLEFNSKLIKTPSKATRIVKDFAPALLDAMNAYMLKIQN